MRSLKVHRPSRPQPQPEPEAETLQLPTRELEDRAEGVVAAARKLARIAYGDGALSSVVVNTCFGLKITIDVPQD